MNKQTQDYITLKPISDRFKEVASSITDDEIKALIGDELRKQIKEQVHLGYHIDDILDMDEMQEFIKESVKEGIKNKFK